MLANKTIGIGVVLIFLGVAGYLISGRVSITALIPAFFGAPLVLLGWLARDDRKRKLVMHIAVVVGLLGFLGSVGGLFEFFGMLAGQETARPGAVVARAIMAVITGYFVAVCVKSFIDARRQRPES